MIFYSKKSKIWEKESHNNLYNPLNLNANKYYLNIENEDLLLNNVQRNNLLNIPFQKGRDPHLKLLNIFKIVLLL